MRLVTSLRRQLGITQRVLGLLGVHPMTRERMGARQAATPTWQRSLVAALLLSQPRANLEQRSSKTLNRIPSSCWSPYRGRNPAQHCDPIPSVPFYPAPHLPPTSTELTLLPDPLRLLLCRCRPPSRPLFPPGSSRVDPFLPPEIGRSERRLKLTLRPSRHRFRRRSPSVSPWLSAPGPGLVRLSLASGPSRRNAVSTAK